MVFTEEEFKRVKKIGEELYKTFDEVFCPYFGERISFSSQGLGHLKFKKREKTRLEQDQYMRFKLLGLAPEVLKRSHTVQGILESKHFERIRVNSRTESVLKDVIYYEFISVIGRNRVRIIVKQVENGKKFFWSIIPYWGMNKKTMVRVLHEGNPEED